ncbi:hypothetical protein ABL78_2807 [Leptomonas seymouri]|uniref:Uncharacterized protein n=1 Tax=Leptomonas seymouri TaxID=5684 RepID=A0A0N1PCX5_LEPSE|nr:hypothetical protein ABL78_2807 [Leptomonas seymouri]|eukprot:KPI88120.1 hypothetical protein ABL78_2807 [Leptomonas seymouri]
MGDFELQMRVMQHSVETDPAPYMSEDVFSTNVDAAHGPDSGVAALATHTNFFHGFTAEEEDEDDENPNDMLLRLLKEVRAVDSDVDDDNDMHKVIDRNSDENAAGVLFSVTDSSGGAKNFNVPYSGAIHSSTTAAGGTVSGGFTVEGNTSYSSAASLPPPPPPPPAYGTPSTAPRSPFINCYSGIPHLTATPGSTKPPPTFAEAMATSHGTPVSLPGRPSSSQERSPAMATYAPPMPAAPQETVLLRNCNGIFLLQPLSKPTPPYTPPAGCNSPPVSPLSRYTLPPAAMMAGPNAATANNSFLGASVAQVSSGRPTASAAVTELPHYAPYGAAGGGSPFISTAVPFVSAMSSVRGTPSFAAAPPPYTGGL